MNFNFHVFSAISELGTVYIHESAFNLKLAFLWIFICHLSAVLDNWCVENKILVLFC